MIGRRRTSGGFTLIELMVGVIVAGILLTMAVPSFQDVIASNALRSTTSDLITALNTARAQAVSTRRAVTLRPVGGSNAWSDGWELVYDTGAGAVERDQSFTPGKAVTVIETGGLTELVFDRSGRVGNDAAFQICDGRSGETGREVSFGRFGALDNNTFTCN